MANGLLPGKYADFEFYGQGDVADRLKGLGIEPGSVRKVTVEEEKFGLLDTATLRKITLLDKNGDPLETLFAKIYTPGKSEERTNISSTREKIEKSVAYRYENLKFQNDLGLITPFVVQKGTYACSTRNAGRRKRKEEDTSVLLMDYWEGPTADMDVMALRRAIAIREGRLGEAVNEEMREKLSSEIISLRETLKRDIVLSALNAIEEFSNKTTLFVEENGLKLPNTNIRVNSERDSYKFFFGKRERQFRALLHWNLIKQSSKSIEEIIAGEETFEVVKRWKEFRDLIKPFRKYMFTEGRSVYSQGDQHLHNFKRVRLKSSDEASMGIFDMGSVRMEDPLFGASRLLSSYLLDLNRGQILKLYEDGSANFVAKYKPDMNRDETRLAFELCTLIETMWGASRRAHDSTYNWGEFFSHTSVFEERPVDYQNVKLPLAHPIVLPGKIDYGAYYSASDAIAANKKRMQNILMGLKEDIVGHYRKPELEDPLKRLEEFLEDNVIETKV